MKPALTALLIGTLALAGCGQVSDSRFNPLNWFGKSEEGKASLAPEEGYAAAAIDNRALVGEVTALEVTRTPGGALVVARGLPPTQGWWDAELVAVNDGRPDAEGDLVYTFRVAAPRGPAPAAPPQVREVTAGIFVSEQTLGAVRRIVVVGQTNSRSAAR